MAPTNHSLTSNELKKVARTHTMSRYFLMCCLYLVLSALTPISFINDANAQTPYGKPTYDTSTDAGLYLWKNTDESWSLRATAGGIGNYSNYVGNLSADQAYSNVTPFSIEPHDVLDLSNSNVISFDLQIWGKGEDGIDFTLPAGATACFTVDTPAGVSITVGADNMVLTTPFELTTLGACGVPAVPSLSVNDVTVLEGAGTASFNVTLSPASTEVVNVNVVTLDGTATSPEDYTALASTILTFNPGDTTQTVTIPIIDDSIGETNENYTVNLSNPINATINKGSGTGIITDNDLSACGAPSYDPAIDGAVFIWNDCGTNQWYLRATAGSYGFLTHNGNLSSDLGFTNVIPYSLETNDIFDTSDPNQITFNLQMSSPWSDGFDFELPAGSNACLSMDVPGGSGPPAEISVFLGANRHQIASPFNLQDFGSCGQASPTLSVTDVTVGEGDGMANFQVTLNPASTDVVTVEISTTDGTATAPGDYTALSPSTVTFNPGVTSIPVSVTIIDDAAGEGQESFTLNLANAVNANLSTVSATGTIIDNDLSACGIPSYDAASEEAIFLWQNCSTGQWNLRATAGTTSFVQYNGMITSDQGFTSVTPFSLEANDILDTSDPGQVNFSLQMSSPWQDGFGFQVPAGADVCLTIDSPNNASILLGSNKSQVTSPINLTTLQPCALPPPSDSPNFVVILTDDQRWDSLWAMPILQQKLGNRGVNFTNAFITTPLCCPARASFLSGFYPHNNGVLQGGGDNGGELKFRPHDNDTLATNLQAAGYKTMLAGGKYLNDYRPPYVPPGWTKFINNNIGPFSADWFNFDVTIGSSTDQATTGQKVTVNQYVTNYHRDQVLNFLDGTGNSPFFVFFSVFAPHAKATPDIGDEGLFSDYVYRGRGYNETDLSDKPDWLANPNRSLSIKTKPEDDEFHREMLRSLQSVDRAIGAIVDKVESKGLMDKTVFIFTSDNGYLWGEHGVNTKGMAYEESTRVPFIVVMPGITPRTETAMTAPNIDIGATLYDLAGISKDVDGLSLTPLLQDTNSAWRSDLVFQHWGSHEGAFGTWSAIRTENFKYIENAYHEKELYDLVNDPFELESKHNDPAFASTLGTLATELESRRGLAATTYNAPAGKVGNPYSLEITAWGGQEPYTWSIFEGTLPQGLSLNPTTGVISGTPTQAETQLVKIKIHDSSIAKHTGEPQQVVAPGSRKEVFTFVINP